MTYARLFKKSIKLELFNVTLLDKSIGFRFHGYEIRINSNNHFSLWKEEFEFDVSCLRDRIVRKTFVLFEYTERSFLYACIEHDPETFMHLLHN